MQLGPRLKQLLQQWRHRCAARPDAVPPPDPADCGTAWGLDLSVRPRPPRAPARSKRAG